jgi:O-acetyl-ADP-ribose deacetylase (regulator of RNase III)
MYQLFIRHLRHRSFGKTSVLPEQGERIFEIRCCELQSHAEYRDLSRGQPQGREYLKQLLQRLRGKTMTREFPGGKSLQLLKGDITKVPVDAIVNAANSQLAGGGGVDGAIHLAAGPAMRLELDEIRAKQGGCPTGSAVATSAGNLPAKYVFHAVGPVYEGDDGGVAEKLASAYRSCLRLAEDRGVKYISFPSISTGVYGYPVNEAAPIALGAVVEHLRRETTKLQKAVFVLFDDRTLRAYRDALGALIPAQVAG